MMPYFDFSFWQNFGSNLLATLIGVALGIPVAFWINRRVEKNTEKEKKQRILNSLNIELSLIRASITKWKNEGSNHEEMANLGMALHDEGWKAFSDGGELQWIKDPLLLYFLSNVYGRLEYVKLLSEKYFDIITFRTNKSATIARTVAQELRDAIDRLDGKIDEALEEIKEHQDALLKKNWFEKLLSKFRKEKGVYISD